MLTNKKAQAVHVWKWLLYVPMTAIIVFVITYIPGVVLSGSVKTSSMENEIFSERIFNAMSVRDSLLFRTYAGHTCTSGCFDQKFIENTFDNTDSLREVGFRLTFKGKSIFFNKDFYEDAVVLAPVRYDRFVEERPVLVVDAKNVGKLEIDQVYSGRMKKLE